MPSADIVIDDAKGTWAEMRTAGKLGSVYDEEDVQILWTGPLIQSEGEDQS